MVDYVLEPQINFVFCGKNCSFYSVNCYILEKTATLLCLDFLAASAIP